jgi:hypothetical protein
MFVLPLLALTVALASDVVSEPAPPPRRACRARMFDGTVCRPVGDRSLCVTASVLTVTCPEAP